jgi:hypothetical protein
MIRAQAVSALAWLIPSEDPSELQEGEKSILDVLLDVMAIDLPRKSPKTATYAYLHLHTVQRRLPRSPSRSPP